MSGEIDEMAPYAGQNAGLTNESRPAGTVVEGPFRETRETIDGLSGRSVREGGANGPNRSDGIG